ncbi:dynein axonemal heavy chain 12-like [Hetaerina americana]|uniref:dynein axonemal heavy chain 12-like n=1 Tax=Hetaerina americana TaxID=62018 RepID=UPI003A7F275F
MEELGSTLLQGKVPAEWLSVSYPSLKSLGSYIKDLKARVSFFQGWQKGDEPSMFWLPGFFNPKALVVGSMQNYSLKIGVPMSGVRLVVGTPRDSYVDSGLCVYGLHLEGASWDQSLCSINEAKPGVPYYEMPELTIFALEVGGAYQDDWYSCPLYNSPDRKKSLCSSCNLSNYIVSIDIKCHESPEYWIKRGAAFVCQTEE